MRDDMKVTVAKLLRLLGKVVTFVVIVAGVMLLIAERMHENSFVNFIRALM